MSMIKRLETWQRNLYVVFAAQLIVMVGFSFIFPLMPLYVQELGVSDPGRAAFWAGLLAAGGGASMFVFSPIWGTIADRFGRKLMVLRAMFGAALVIGAMGFVSDVYQLLGLRLLQGCLSGTIAASMALVASMTPNAKIGYSMGLLQMAMFLGTTFGPLMGGVIADILGFRAAFLATGMLLMAGGLIVLIFVEERFQRPEKDRPEGKRSQFLQDLWVIVSSKQLLPALGVLFLARAGPSVISPILPIYVKTLTTAGHVATISGLALSLLGLVSAVSAAYVGRISERTGLKIILIISCLGSGIAYVPQALVHNVVELLILMAILGFFKGGLYTSSTAMIAVGAPRQQQGAAQGVAHSAGSLGHAVGPFAGGSLAASLGLRPVFALTGVLFIIAASILPKIVTESKAHPEDRLEKEVGKNLSHHVL